MELHSMGLYHRLRYIYKLQFIPESIDNDKIYVMTTSEPRAIESAQQYLIGLQGSQSVINHND